MENRDIFIRGERETDRNAIGRIHDLAFGHDWESKIIERLRQEKNFDPSLSLVAELDGRVIGHTLFTRVSVVTPASEKEAIILAPLSVLESYRGIGAGSLLVREGIRRCKEKGFSLVLVYGGSYYERFGFALAHPVGIFRPNPMPKEEVRYLELVPGAVKGVSGVIKYPASFGPLVNEWYPGASL